MTGRPPGPEDRGEGRPLGRGGVDREGRAPVRSTTFYNERGRTAPAWRAWQLSAIACAFLSLAGYWTLTSTAGEARRAVLASPTGAPPHLTLLLAGRDVAYCYYHQPCKDQNSEAARRVTRTDTIMLVKVEGTSVSVLTIPRDTQAGEDGGKINAAYSVGGPEALAARVEEITGERVDAYAVVRTTWVASVVDALGGLDVNVPEPGIEWVDNAAGVNFKLAPGAHHLNGADAVLFMRVRKGFGDDYGRMDHQKAALAQIVDRLRSAAGLAKVTPLLLNFRSGVETNADPRLFEAMRPFLGELQLGFATLPTNEIRGSTNLAPDREALQALWGGTPVAASATLANVRVYDASGAGLGEKVAWALRARGVAKVAVEVEPESGEASRVFTLDDLPGASRVARFLSLPRLQGLRFEIERGETGVFLGRDARERYAELARLPLPTSLSTENP